MVISNVVNKETLRKVQLETLETLKNILMNSFGPYGSNSIIYKEGALPRYTKDGHTILGSVLFNGPIEKSVHTDIEEETRTQAIKIGDSTTSITILSALIFKAFSEYEASHTDIPPADLVRAFQNTVKLIKDKISTHGKEVTLEDMHNISVISTNNNEKLVAELDRVYEKFGTDVYIDVKASMTDTTFVKEFNGMSMDCGFYDATFINTSNNTCDVMHPAIYAFYDPIDTQEMGAFLDKILADNIMIPMSEKRFDDVVPTVILAPKISRDFSAYLGVILESFNKSSAANKGFLNIITGIQSCDMDQYEDIIDLCGARFIKKFLDPEVQKMEISHGNAPTLDTVHEFAGHAEMITSDSNRSTFINPALRYDDNGNDSDVYTSKLEELEKNVEILTAEGNTTTDIYYFKKRLHSLRGKMVEIYVGGITTADRDQDRDLMEDAALNCRSASVAGVGYGANFEGLRASQEVLADMAAKNDYDSIERDMANIIYNAYWEISSYLYSTVIMSEENVENTIKYSLKTGCPYNIRTTDFDGKVLSSINTDICSLDTISKIITIMATSNQFLLPTPSPNMY